MKQTLLLSFLSMGLLTACSTAFQAGQTPDDVYYSPGREVVEVQDNETDRQKQEAYREYVSNQDDQYLRMKISNRYRWGALDNFDYWYDSRYDFGNYYSYSKINPYASWNPGWNQGFGYNRWRPGSGGWGWSSPVYTVIHYSIPKYSPGGSTSGSILSAYRNKNFNNNNYGYKDLKNGGFVPANGNSSFGNLLKRVFTGTADNGSSYDRPARTFNNNYTTPNSTPSPASSNAGGNSGGFKSAGSSTGTGRGGKG